MIAVQFGAGNIGRGFIAALLQQSGYKVTFADVVDDIVNEINEKHKYIVHITDEVSEDILIDNVDALNSTSAEIVDKIACADLITTAVGVNILPIIAPTIAEGLKARIDNNNAEYLNIIACENAVFATDKLKEAVYSELGLSDKEFADKYIGFANCSVDRIVPPVCETNMLDVAVERFFEWNICNSELKGKLEIKGANFVDELKPYIERKLFTLNTGHAITAYLGFINNKATIEDSINCNDIYKIVKSAMIESGSGLCLKYGFAQNQHVAYIDKIISRFKNPYLHDDVARVGREPLRKLSFDDRLVKPTLTSYDRKFSVDNLLIGIAAALHFNNPEDSESVLMQEKIASYGLHDAIVDITGIANKDLINKIEEKYYELLDR